MAHKHTFLPQEFLARVRDGRTLKPDDIKSFIDGIKTGQTGKEQIGAFVMAIRLKGLDKKNITDLTKALRDSGDVMSWDLPGPIVDKHSTGGVGDNVSLILAPILAVCGAYVPMISGAGLGHTGGTLDKLAAIPGYNIGADNELFKKIVSDIGCAIIGQTKNLAPADKVLYATRSTTASVDSIPLITASILSKKLAEGLNALVLDIKCGNGAMMQTKKQAEELAKSLVGVSESAGVKTASLITDMNQPLASAAGNALEVINAVSLLKGKSKDERLKQTSLALCAKVLAICGLAKNEKQGVEQAKKALASGAALEKFSQMVTALGGPKDFCDNMDKYLPPAPVIKDISAKNSGIVTKIDCRAIGIAVIILGGGRKKSDDKIDYRVGFDNLLQTGQRVKTGDRLARIHAASEISAQEAGKMLESAYIIS